MKLRWKTSHVRLLICQKQRITVNNFILHQNMEIRISKKICMSYVWDNEIYLPAQPVCLQDWVVIRTETPQFLLSEWLILYKKHKYTWLSSLRLIWGSRNVTFPRPRLFLAYEPHYIHVLTCTLLRESSKIYMTNSPESLAFTHTQTLR